MDFRLKRYKKDFEYSYSFGVFPTLELLEYAPTFVLGVITHPKGSENDGVSKIRENCQKNGISYEIQEKTFSRIGARGNDYAIGVFQKFDKQLSPSANHVILVNPSGMGNIGTIIRTMLGFGFGDLAVIQPAADIFHPDVVRASMGAIFQMRVARFSDFAQYRKNYPRNIYSLMTDGANPIQGVKFKSPYSLVFGSESTGLPKEFHQLGSSVRIPQSVNIDSLNLGISVGITLYQSKIQELGSKE